MPATISKPIPAANELVERARLRLAAELERLPPLGSPLLRARLRARMPESLPSPGAYVHYIRAAWHAGEQRMARELFVLLLERIEGPCARWAAQCVARTPEIAAGERAIVREELRQELTLRLWEQIALGKTVAWELFFQQSLAFAEQHTAAALMQQHGYWSRAGVTQSRRAAHWLLTRLAETSETPDESSLPSIGGALLADGVNHFSGAELADLRALVLRLPARERSAVVLRFWQDATEAEIAQALRVTPRTVRTYLRQSYALLREWYGEPVNVGNPEHTRKAEEETR
jgi:hypothetical protein